MLCSMQYDFLLCVQELMIATRLSGLVCSLKGPYYSCIQTDNLGCQHCRAHGELPHEAAAMSKEPMRCCIMLAIARAWGVHRTDLPLLHCQHVL